MNQEFGVTPEQLRLTIDSPKKAVDLVRDLLWVEACRQGIDPASITFSDRIYAKDGGVDGTANVKLGSTAGLVGEGDTIYQIKWGHSFNPLEPKNIKSELLNKNGVLKTKLKKLTTHGGNYVLLWFGGSLKSDENTQATEEIGRIFDSVGGKPVQVKVLEFTHLVQHCGYHIVIQSKYFTDLGKYFLTIEQWVSRFRSELPSPLARVASQEVSGFMVPIEKVNNSDLLALRAAVMEIPSQPVQIFCSEDKDDARGSFLLTDARNLVYEALKEDGYSQNTIVIDAAELVAPMSSYLEQSAHSSFIVVIDKCKKEHFAKVLDVLGQRQHRLKFVVLSIDGQIIADSRFSFLGRPGLSASPVFKSLSHSASDAIPSISFTQLVPGQVVLNRPASLEKAYKSILRDYGHEVLNSVKRVIRFIALFSKVGSEINVTPEMRLIAKKLGFVEDHDWLRFSEYIKILRQENIIEGNYYINIADEDSRHFLIQEWWAIYGVTVSFEQYLREIYIFSEDLAQRLIDSIPFITATDSGKRVSLAMLGEGGPFTGAALLNDKFGALLFQKLAEADPEAALACLKRVLTPLSREELQSMVVGRRSLMWALEKIVIWKALFIEGARLILRLAEAENESWSNNAAGVFTDLFSPGMGDVAITELPPLQRFPVLLDAFNSQSERVRLLAIQAAGKALESDHFSRVAGSEEQGLRKKPELWIPKTYGELFAAYDYIWKLLVKVRSEKVTPEEDKKIVDILIARSRKIVTIRSMASTVISTLEEISKSSEHKPKVLAGLITILYYEGKNLPNETKSAVAELRDKLIGTEFPTRLRRFVGMSLIEDHFNDQGDQVDQVQGEIEKLAAEAVHNHTLVIGELSWLAGKEPQNGFRFGYELGRLDGNIELEGVIVAALKELGDQGNSFFVGGYFRALYEADSQKWELILDGFSRDEAMIRWIPELTWRSGVSDRAVKRMLELAEKGLIDPDQFQMFGIGSVIEGLSESVIEEWITFLLKTDRATAVSTALDFANFYYVQKKRDSLPKELVYSLLTHEKLFEPRGADFRHQMDEHYWSGLAEKFLEVCPEYEMAIATKLFEHFGEDDTLLDNLNYTSIKNIINTIAKKHPAETWAEIAKYLNPPFDSRSYHISQWLKGGALFSESEEDGALPLIAREGLWDWIEKDVDQRAWYAATFVPKVLFHSEDGGCLARELLVWYGDRKDVRNNLSANFSMEGWSGEASLHYQGKKAMLLKFREGEANENVKLWIDGYVAGLDSQIERAKIEEERGYF